MFLAVYLGQERAKRVREISHMPTLYERLGVTPQASQSTIRQSFYRLVKKFDPYSPANEDDAAARLQYFALHDAYRILSYPDARQKYDLNLRAQSSMQPI